MNPIPEPSLEGFLAYCKTKNPKIEFEWSDPHMCAVTQYYRAIGWFTSGTPEHGSLQDELINKFAKPGFYFKNRYILDRNIPTVHNTWGNVVSNIEAYLGVVEATKKLQVQKNIVNRVQQVKETALASTAGGTISSEFEDSLG